MKRTKRYSKLRKKGQGEWWKLVNGIIAIGILLLIVVMLFKYWSPLSKAFGSVGEKVVSLTPGITDLITNNFKLLSAKDQERAILNTFNLRNRCGLNKNEKDNERILNQYNIDLKKVKSDSKLAEGKKETYLKEFDRRRLECYTILGQITKVRNLNLLDKSERIESLLNIHPFKCTEGCKNIKEEIEKLGVKLEILTSTQRTKLNALIRQKEELDILKKERSFSTFSQKLEITTKAEEYRNLLKENPFLKSTNPKLKSKIDAYRNFVEFQADFLENKNNCQKLGWVLGKYSLPKYKDSPFFYKSSKRFNKNKPLSLVALEIEADNCAKKNPLLYTHYNELLLKHQGFFSNEKEKEAIKNKIKAGCGDIKTKDLCQAFLKTRTCSPLYKAGFWRGLRYKVTGGLTFDKCISCSSTDAKKFSINCEEIASKYDPKTY